MANALEVELKQYAHNLVADHVKYEYDRQINRWLQYINLMVDAQKEALNRQQGVLNEARTQIEKERQAAFGLVMLAFSLASGPILSWVAGRIQYNWFPKVASRESIKRRVAIVSQNDKWVGLNKLSWVESDYDKVHAKVFGDLGKQILGLGIDKVLKVVKPDTQDARNAVDAAAKSVESSFKSQLENAMRKQAEITSNAIMSLAMSINENSSYGAECLAKLRKENRRAQDPKVPEKELETLAKQMIRSDVNRHRAKWAEDWFYFGNDPPFSAIGLAERIEKELWGLWILNEEFHVVSESTVHDPIEDAGAANLDVVHGKTFGRRGVPEQVLRRLADFGVVEARTQLQKLRQIAADGVREQKEAEFKKQQKKDDELQRQIEDLEDSRSPNPQLARFNRALQREARKKQRPTTPTAPQTDPERPQIKVRSLVDTQGEVSALESWAKHHPLSLAAGTMNYRSRRPLSSIETIF